MALFHRLGGITLDSGSYDFTGNSCSCEIIGKTGPSCTLKTGGAIYSSGTINLSPSNIVLQSNKGGCQQIHLGAHIAGKKNCLGPAVFIHNNRSRLLKFKSYIVVYYKTNSRASIMCAQTEIAQ